MKTTELRELSEQELIRKLGEFKRQLLELRMQATGGKLAKPHQMGILRRDIARVMTLLSQGKRQQAGQQPAVV
jgi:large subunit ribosomal protein L29